MAGYSALIIVESLSLNEYEVASVGSGFINLKSDALPVVADAGKLLSPLLVPMRGADEEVESSPRFFAVELPGTMHPPDASMTHMSGQVW